MASRSNEGGILATVLGLLVLALAGFGLGLLVGGVWEEPELVARYLVDGEDETVVEMPASLPNPIDVAEAQPTRQPWTSLSPTPPVSSAPPPRLDRMAVQVGAFSDSKVAESLAQRLRGKGYEVYLSPGADSGDARWRVRVGPLQSSEHARRVADRLKSEEELPTWVLTEKHGG